MGQTAPSAAQSALSTSLKTWNGRLAMLCFVIGVRDRITHGKGILSQIGSWA